VLSPYSNRSWTQEDQSNLASFTASIGQILQHTHQANNLTQELEQPGKHLWLPRCASSRSIAIMRNCGNELASSQEQNAYTSARAESLAAMLANPEVEQTSGSLSAHIAELEQENRQLKAIVNNNVSDTRGNGRTASMSGEIVPEVSPESVKMLSSIAQELRQPISSLIGYTDYYWVSRSASLEQCNGNSSKG